MNKYLIKVKSEKEEEYYIDADNVEKAMEVAIEFFLNDEDVEIKGVKCEVLASNGNV